MVVLALTVLPSYRLSAQSQPLTLAGRLVLARGADSIPVRGAYVVAHAISTRNQGPVDSVRSDAAGRFRLTVRRPDSATVYVVSALHHGIGYFSEPFGAAARAGAGNVTLVVYDTASAGPPLSVGSRHVVVTGADQTGARRVLDVVEIRNAGSTTRVGADSLAATWRMRLPDGVTDYDVGESEIAASAIRFSGREVVVAAPIAPGERQIAITYLLPANAARLDVPVDQPTADFEVLAEDSMTSAAAVVQRADPLVLEGRIFQRFVAANVRPGSVAAVTLSPAGSSSRRLMWIPIVAVALALAGGAVYALRVAPR